MFFQGSDFLGISLRIDSMERGGKKKKLPLVSGSESWRFSAAPSNYNNELRRSNATPRHPEKQARDSSTEGVCVCESVCAEMGAITALFGHSCGHDLLMRKEIRFGFGIMVKIISRLGHCRVCVQ